MVIYAIKYSYLQDRNNVLETRYRAEACLNNKFIHYIDLCYSCIIINGVLYTSSLVSLSPPSDTTLEVYINDAREFVHVEYNYVGTTVARKFKVIIDSFSEELTILNI